MVVRRYAIYVLLIVGVVLTALFSRHSSADATPVQHAAMSVLQSF